MTRTEADGMRSALEGLLLRADHARGEHPIS
jgi:hypothetical protein